MTPNEEKPPYVEFETRSVEDRNATIEAGHYVGIDVDYAIITPQGSRDRVERVAKDWLDYISEQAKNDRFNPMWVQGYKSIYKEWKEGREIPVDGTAIITWPAISVTQQKTILSANIRTVEDLANANEAALNSIGIGARNLQQKAQAWLETANGTGKLAERLSALEAKSKDLENRNATLEAENKALQAKLEAAAK